MRGLQLGNFENRADADAAVKGGGGGRFAGDFLVLPCAKLGQPTETTVKLDLREHASSFVFLDRFAKYGRFFEQAVNGVYFSCIVRGGMVVPWGRCGSSFHDQCLSDLQTIGVRIRIQFLEVSHGQTVTICDSRAIVS